MTASTCFEAGAESSLSVSVLRVLGLFKLSTPTCGPVVAPGERQGVANVVMDASQSSSSNKYEGQVTVMPLSEGVSSVSSSSCWWAAGDTNPDKGQKKDSTFSS